MNQWKAEEAILEKIGELARTYTPEWEFSRENPDAGSVIAMIFAKQMGRNAARADESLPWYEKSLIQMLGLSPLPPSPARGNVVLELVQDVIEGVAVPEGSRLLAGQEEGGETVFETMEPVYVTNSRLTDILEISGEQGKIVPRLGGAGQPLDGGSEGWEEAGRLPFRLFGLEGDNISRSGLLVCHESLFGASGGTVYLEITGSSSFRNPAGRLSDPEAFACYGYTVDGFRRLLVEEGDRPDKLLILKPDREFSQLPYEGGSYGMIYIQALKHVTDVLTVHSLRLSAAPFVGRPDFLGCGEDELRGEAVYPFGNQLELYKEFFIGSDAVFQKAGARIRLSFTLSYEEREISYEAEEEEAELKPVMKRAREAAGPAWHRVRAQQVFASYYNGTGWRTLVCWEEGRGESRQESRQESRKEGHGKDAGGIFGGEDRGRVTVTFTCPEDWKETAIGGYEGRVLRFVITKADHCYFVPSVHLLPVLSEPVLACSYEDVWLEPDRVFGLNGTKLIEKTEECLKGKGFAAFSPLPYDGNCLYLGFDKKFKDGPVSLFFRVHEETYLKPVRLHYEYSTSHGFKRLSVADRTGEMTDSGTVRFFPPSDLAAAVVAGQRRFWIRLVKEEEPGEPPCPCLTQIDEILVNVAEITNVETMDEESYYLDEPVPGLEISLGDVPVLDALVYVNENSSLTAAMKKGMLEESPGRVRMEQNYAGETSSFFVRWEEIEDLRRCGPGDRRYQLDRRRNVLKFGDGVHGRMPAERRGAAFTVSVRGCGGRAGNVAAGEVDTLLSHLLFIGRVWNPDGAHGGCDVEHEEHLLRRGTGLLGGNGRLVSGPDYVREALLFSSHISQAALKPDGKGMRLVLLMEDYKDGSDSFNLIKGPLKKRLLERGGIGWGEERLSIMEPEFVSLDVKVWVRLQNSEEAFAVRERIRKAVSAFIEPAASEEGGGWPIGTLPREDQFQVMLQAIRFDGYVEHFIVTARWNDGNKSHEADLKRFAAHPFAVGVNGRHEIHLSAGKWE